MTARTPLYEAFHSDRYERQALIRQYQDHNDCRLIVVRDILFPDSITYFEDTLFGARSTQDLHVMLSTPGGHGETALRMVRQAQSRCRALTVIVPDQAKSAGTLFALGADRIYMGPASDLGPVDPQLMLPDGSLCSAKAIIAATKRAEESVRAHPATHTFHLAQLAPITALMVQQARDQLARTDDLVRETLAAVQARSESETEDLAKALKDPLIEESKDHGAVVSAADARGFGLPVQEADPAGENWQFTWRLWMKYVALGQGSIYEGDVASHEFFRQSPS